MQKGMQWSTESANAIMGFDPASLFSSPSAGGRGVILVPNLGGSNDFSSIFEHIGTCRSLVIAVISVWRIHLSLHLRMFTLVLVIITKKDKLKGHGLVACWVRQHFMPGATIRKNCAVDWLTTTGSEDDLARNKCSGGMPL